MAAESSVDLAALWRAMRGPVAIAVTALALVTALAAIGASSHNQSLDPRNATPNGARALAVLLAERGVAVHLTTTVAQITPAPGTTVLLSQPAKVSPQALRQVLRTSATVVMIDPPTYALAAADAPNTANLLTSTETVSPQCGFASAATAGAVRLAGTFYQRSATATDCYVEGDDAALVVLRRPNGARTVILGSPATLSNAQLAKQGDAALAIGMLDSAVLRWVPAGLHAGPVPKSQQGLLNLLPRRVVLAIIQLMIALVVLALWRARRLGKPVAEPLPVIVRAAETVEGRARLMRAAHSRAGAAAALRAASIERLTRALRLRADEEPSAVVAVVAAASQRPDAEVNAVLYGGEPANDQSLVALAEQLPDLEAAVHGSNQRPGGPQ